MKSVEEYLYFNVDNDYEYLKLVTCTYFKSKQKLIARYIYAESIEERLPVLKKKLEELFIKQVGLPIKYEFIYKKVYIDNLVLQLDILAFLRQKYKELTKEIKDADVKVNLDNNTWRVNIFLEKSFAEFLENSKQWQKFKEELKSKNFFDFEFYINTNN